MFSLPNPQGLQYIIPDLAVFLESSVFFFCKDQTCARLTKIRGSFFQAVQSIAFRISFQKLIHIIRLKYDSAILVTVPSLLFQRAAQEHRNRSKYRSRKACHSERWIDRLGDPSRAIFRSLEHGCCSKVLYSKSM